MTRESSDDGSPVPLEYRTPIDARPGVSVALARQLLVASFVPGAVGVLIMLAFLLTEASGVAMIGFLFLGIGGLMTFACGVCGVVGWAGTYSRSGDVTRARRLFSLVVLVSLLTVPLAGVCAAVGSYFLENPKYTLNVTNSTGRTIDATLHFEGGQDRTLIALRPTEIRSLRTRRLGPIVLDVRADGRVRSSPVRQHFDSDDANSAKFGGDSIDIRPDHLP